MVLCISIEGLIGAGKTTLIEQVVAALRARGKKVAYASEPVKTWEEVGALKLFYKNPPRYAYTFQTFTYITRVKQIIKACQAVPDVEILITERCPYTDRNIFMELQRAIVTKEEMVMYDMWCDFWLDYLPEDLREGFKCGSARAIYLRPSIEACMARVTERARAGEVEGVPEEYQLQLYEAHEAYLCGKGRDKFPEMPPTPFSDVRLVEGDRADHDFRVTDAGASEETKTLVKELCDFIVGRD